MGSYFAFGKRYLLNKILSVVAAGEVEQPAHVVDAVQLGVHGQAPAVQRASSHHQGPASFY